MTDVPSSDYQVRTDESVRIDAQRSEGSDLDFGVDADPNGSIGSDGIIETTSTGTRASPRTNSFNVPHGGTHHVDPWPTHSMTDNSEPEVWNGTLADADGNGVVGVGESVTVTANATDTIGVANVTADASAFGAGTVTLSHEYGGLYSGSFTVEGASADADGNHAVTIVATDSGGNQNATTTNVLELDTTPLTVRNATATDASGNDVVADGESVTVSADVIAVDEVKNVTTDASAFGAGTVTLTDGDGDGTYEATFTAVLPKGTAMTRSLTITAYDADVTANSSDANPLTLDAKDPKVSLTAIDDGSPTTPSGSRTVYTNGTVSSEIASDGTPGDPATVTVELVADFTNFRHEIAATEAGSEWRATENLWYLPDDGKYTVALEAVDGAGNRNRTTTDATVLLDRNDPTLAATLTRVNGSTGRVNVTASEELTGTPTIDVTLPNGTVVTPTITETGATWWNASFPMNGSGQYDVSVTGTDLAGNVGDTTATTNVTTVSTVSDEATVLVEPSGLFVNLTTNRSVTDSFVTLTRSDDALAPLTAGDAGVSFLDARFEADLAENLSSAEIGVPVDTSGLPTSDPDAVTIHYYDESDGEWEAVETSVEDRTVGGTTRKYWIANVTHLSTYGALATDTEPPTLDGYPTLLDGSFGGSDPWFKMRFDYSDDFSDVNASAVRLIYNGVDVTDDPKAIVTGEFAIFNSTDLSPVSNDLRVMVVDEAGNAETYDDKWEFNIGHEDGESSGDESGGGGSVPPPSLLKEVTQLPDGGVEMTIQNGLTGRTAQQYFDGIQAGDVTFDRLRVTYAHDLQTFTFRLHPSTGVPDGTSALTGANALGYLTVDHEVQNSYFESVQLRFEVPESALPDGATLDDVALYRIDGSAWIEMVTNRRDTTFKATAVGFATYAVGVDMTAEETATPTPDDGPATTDGPTTDAPTTTPEDGQPGFGVVLALLALLAAGLLRRA